MLYHDSRNPEYRTPRFAGVCSSRITLRLRALGNPERVWLRLWWDGAERRQPMTPCGASGDLYEAVLELPGHPGLLWYHFIAEYARSPLYYGNARDQLGGEGAVAASEPPSFQITVYDPAYQTPGWLSGGLMYQIMPDRFRASRPVKERPAPEGGHWHANWLEPPELRLADGDNAADDYFGGDLRGVIEKLPYLSSLGVTVIYFNPIFRARSNHKYNTGDYRQIDPGLGTRAEFRALCQRAKALGISVMLDGVFSHTGSDSRYFNRDGTYPGLGAYQSPESPYASWYRFRRWPDEYDCWWGFQTLPNVNEMDEHFLDFIIDGEDSVCAHWLDEGASGWRLDVADELPMDFLRRMRARVKRVHPERALLGEVWEDASNKVAYGETRCYCLGDTLDSTMNYPLREALMDFMLERASAEQIRRRLEHAQENYPPPFYHAQMNLLGSHDRARAINALAGEPECPREARSAARLTGAQYALGKRRFLAAWAFLCAMPGTPCLYYGDEAGAQGMNDPFNRGTYPWGHEDLDMLLRVQSINRSRGDSPALRLGEARFYSPDPALLVVARRISGGRDALGNPCPDDFALCALNRSAQTFQLTLPADGFMPRPVALHLDPISADTLRLPPL